MLLGLHSVYLDPAGLKQDRIWHEFASVADAEAWQNQPLPKGEYRQYKTVDKIDGNDVYSVASALLSGKSPESLGLTFARVGAGQFGAYMLGRIWFTQHQATKDGWIWGFTSDNGVSAYPSGRIHANGRIEKCVESWNPYVKRDTTHWEGPWVEMTTEDIKYARYGRAFFGC